MTTRSVATGSLHTVERLASRVGLTIGSRIDGLFSRVETLAARMDQLRQSASGVLPFDRSRLATLRPLIRELLCDRDPLLEGLGVAVGKGTLVDADRWLEWWHRDSAGELRFVSHVLTSDAIDYYDYQLQDWFRAPQRNNGSTVFGPYYDVDGLETYTTTLLVPMQPDSGGYAVAGGDLALPALENLFIREVGQSTHTFVIVSEDDRVVASTSARYVIGDRVNVDSGSVDVMSRVPSILPGRLSWRIIALNSAV